MGPGCRIARLVSYLIVSAVFVATLCSSTIAEEEFTQNNLAKMLVRVLGLEGRVPAAATIDDYFNLLTTIGVAPLDGWHTDEAITKNDLAVVMVQALGLQGEVEDSLDSEAYTDVLKSEGISFENGVTNIEHGLSFPTVVNSFDSLNFGNSVADRFETSLSPIGTPEGY